MFLLAFIITIPAFISLLNNKYFSMHDDQHIARLFLFDKGIREGYLYPRWVDMLGFGFGYPLFNFYPPLIYYIGEFFHLLGFSYIWSIKLVFITGFILAAIGAYLFSKRYVEKVGAVVVSALYTYFFYHGVTAYVRGALAEFFTMAVLPFVFYFLDRYAISHKISDALYFGIALALLIINHPLIAFPSLIFIGAFLGYRLLTSDNKYIFIRNSAIGGITGLCLSAFFWLPSMLERKYTLVDAILTKEMANYKIHYVALSQFWYSLWGYGGSIAGTGDGVTFQLGKVHIALIIGSIILFFLLLLRKKIQLKNTHAFMFFVGLLLFSLFMTLEYSSFIWDRVSFLWYLQFPWRFLTFAVLFISVVGGYSIFFIRKFAGEKVAIVVASMIVIVLVGVYHKYFKPQYYRDITDAQVTSFEDIAWRISRTSFEFVPSGVKTKKTEFNTTTLAIEKRELPQQPYAIQSGTGTVAVESNKLADKKFSVQAGTPVQFQLNTYNFPGWKAYVDGNEVVIADNNSLKLITITVPQGNHRVEFAFTNTAPRTVGNTLTILSILGIGLYFLKFKKIYN